MIGGTTTNRHALWQDYLGMISACRSCFLHPNCECGVETAPRKPLPKALPSYFPYFDRQPQSCLLEVHALFESFLSILPG